MVRDADGRVVWDADASGFLDVACPPTAHPSLWRRRARTSSRARRRPTTRAASAEPGFPTGRADRAGAATSTGSAGLIAPPLDVTATGQEETLDGGRMVFQPTPGTEDPAEMKRACLDRKAPVTTFTQVTGAPGKWSLGESNP